MADCGGQDNSAIRRLAQQARQASIAMAALNGDAKNHALLASRNALLAHEATIVAANQADLDQAKKENISPVLLNRLKFDHQKLLDVAAGIDSLIALPDPVGRTLNSTLLDDGLELYQVTCPIGVLGIVFESRPDALVQISTLALKSGNAVLLKGGSEASRTNKALAEAIDRAGVPTGLPAGWLALLETRQDVKDMLALDDGIDLVIPRGGNAFVRYIMDNTKIPVLGHADGICHVYIDSRADLDQAVKIALDAKCQYPAVCNAMETLLVADAVAEKVLPLLKAQFDRTGVELRGDDKTRKSIDCKAATEKDWETEYNDLILSIKIVADVDEAIEHINRYSSRHTDAIVTTDKKAAARFLDRVDSANVFWNCSTRFSDGFRYGLGAEVGISTGKIHARGPVGLEGLVIYKWKLIGAGHTVADYSGPAGKKFLHKKIRKTFDLT